MNSATIDPIQGIPIDQKDADDFGDADLGEDDVQAITAALVRSVGAREAVGHLDVVRSSAVRVLARPGISDARRRQLWLMAARCSREIARLGR